jgi:DNA-binding transcriptional MerR regulator
MTISELAKATGLTAHTLRYYEAEGLIPEVERNAAGHRRYRPEHIRWVGLLDRLRTSGMSIARMREYTALAVAGDETVAQRRSLLECHAAEIRSRIGELEQCLAIVQAKIDLYSGRLEDPNVVWERVAEAQRAQRDAVSRGLRAGP